MVVAAARVAAGEVMVGALVPILVPVMQSPLPPPPLQLFINVYVLQCIMIPTCLSNAPAYIYLQWRDNAALSNLATLMCENELPSLVT